MQYANNKGADQPAHPRSLISTFFVRCLESIIHILAKSKILRFTVVSVAEQTRLSLPEDRFSRDETHFLENITSMPLLQICHDLRVVCQELAPLDYQIKQS